MKEKSGREEGFERMTLPAAVQKNGPAASSLRICPWHGVRAAGSSLAVRNRGQSVLHRQILRAEGDVDHSESELKPRLSRVPVLVNCTLIGDRRTGIYSSSLC